MWIPPLNDPQKPACVRLTFQPIDECDASAADIPYRCTIDSPLEFAVCYNGATPESVGCKGVQQVELAPWKPHGN